MPSAAATASVQRLLKVVSLAAIFLGIVLTFCALAIGLFAVPIYDDWSLAVTAKQMDPIEFVTVRWLLHDGRTLPNALFWFVFRFLPADSASWAYGAITLAVLGLWLATLKVVTGHWGKAMLVFLFPVLVVAAFDSYYWIASSVTYLLASALVLLAVHYPHRRLLLLVLASTCSEAVAVGCCIYYFFEQDWRSRTRMIGARSDGYP